MLNKITSTESQENLLSERDDSRFEADFSESLRSNSKIKPARHHLVFILSILLLVSIATNAILITQNRVLHFHDAVYRSEFAGLTYEMPYTYSAKNEWWGENETRADELWDGINTDGIVVALTDDYARKHNLELSGRFPWDFDRGLYFVKGVHDIHCLKLMRNFTKSLWTGEHSWVQWEHYEHCLNALRQDIICRAEDTVMPAVRGMAIGDGQQLACRNWEKLVEWTKKPEQDACYRQVDDYKSAIVAIERHAFCPEGSPYQDIIQEYFKVHGHKNMWTGEDL